MLHSVGLVGLDTEPLQLGIAGLPGGSGVAVQAGVVRGEDLEQMPPDILDDILTHTEELVFARVKPEQKLQVVEACQRLGAVVTVTGDGINDAAAIRRADVGIAMGSGAAYSTKVGFRNLSFISFNCNNFNLLQSYIKSVVQFLFSVHFTDFKAIQSWRYYIWRHIYEK